MTDRKYLERFPEPTIKFLKKLSANNNREWFKENRNLYEENFLQPAMAFVEEVGLHLLDHNPNIQAIPKIDKSIFRLHRDVRFSKNKEPYKTNLGILFWEGKGKKMESSGYYFHIEPKNFFIAAGMYQFSKDQLRQYRDLISIEQNAIEFSKIFNSLSRKGFGLGGKNYKKVPRGYDSEYKYTDLLLHNGVYFFKEGNIEEIAKEDAVKFTVKIFNQLKPIHDWLVEKFLI